MKAIYALSADPIHLGHLWVIETASGFCDELTVAIGDNGEKKHLFSLGDRLEMLEESVAHLNNVQVMSYPKMFLADFVKENQLAFLVRGLRSAKDFDYEKSLQEFNERVHPGLTTLYLSPPNEISFLQSSVIKGIVGYENWEDHVSRMVPPPVMRRLKEWKSSTNSGHFG